MKIAILSDTHNLLRSSVTERLQGCEAILHAGDVCCQSILDQLSAFALVYAVRGNNDREWAEHLPVRLSLTLDGVRICMAHRRKDLPRDLSAFDLGVYGHTHQYAESRMNGTLLLNPGSCGPRRFHQPATMTLLTADAEGLHPERILLVGAEREPLPELGTDIRRQIEVVVRETQRGRSPLEISERHGINAVVAEQIARLYVTHPGVTVDRIMTKLGL